MPETVGRSTARASGVVHRRPAESVCLASGLRVAAYARDVSELRIIRAGLVPYEQAWRMQREIHAARVDGAAPDTVLLLEHPSVYTAGKRTEPFERPFDGTPVIDVDRGGKITWHGPGQLVGYPIVALPDPIDVVAYVRRMEQVLIDVCAELGVDGRPGRGAKRRLAAGRRHAARAQDRRDRHPGRARRHLARLRDQRRPRPGASSPTSSRVASPTPASRRCRPNSVAMSPSPRSSRWSRSTCRPCSDCRRARTAGA